MKRETLCFLIDSKGIYLSEKIKGNYSDSGKLNGYGGKIKRNESSKRAAKREANEEGNIKIEEIIQVARLKFYFENAPEGENWDQIVDAYFARKWKGRPKGSDEMYAPKKYKFDKIPFDRMWRADKLWLPLALIGYKFKAEFVYGANNSVTVKSFEFVDKL